jgi:hypothetical protein
MTTPILFRSIVKRLQKATFLFSLLSGSFVVGTLAGTQPLQAQEAKKTAAPASQPLKAFEGKYQFQFEPGKDSFVHVTVQQGQLVLKETWGEGREITFLPESEMAFNTKEQTFPLRFIKDKNGVVTHLMAFERDLWTKVKE